MKAIILAAGRGSRLGALTDDRPKCLLELGGRTLLEWQVEALKRGGVDGIVVVTGYRHEMIEATGLRTVHNAEWDRSNMVTSLLCAAAEVAEPVIVSYSDIVFRPSVVRGLISAAGDVVISYDRQWLDLWKRRFDDPLTDAESFRIDESGRVLEIGGKVANAWEIEGQYMGLLKLSPAGFNAIKDFVGIAGARTLDMTATLSGLIEAGQPIYGYPSSGAWCEIDSPRDLALAETLISEDEL